MDFKKISVLLVDGADRQTLALSESISKLGCKITTLNSSKLDIGFSSKYPSRKLLDRSIRFNIRKRADAVKKLVKSGEYDVVITTSDDVAELLSQEKDELERYTHIAVVEPDLFYKAYDKSKTMKICMDNGIPCPLTFENVKNINEFSFDKISFPLVVKPKKSFGSIGFHRFDDKQTFAEFCNSIGDNLKEFIIQEYIPQTDIQYECAMFLDETNEVKTSLVFSKNRWFPVDGGSSTCNVSVDRPDIVENCSKLLKLIKWRGPADIDLIQDPRDNVAKIIEINPRVSGSVKIVLKSGVNIARQIIELAMGEKVTEYREYEKGIRLRCIHTDILWFIKSDKRFKTDPPFFSFRKTYDQVWSWKDPLPFFTFSFQAIGKYKREMKKRKR